MAHGHDGETLRSRRLDNELEGAGTSLHQSWILMHEALEEWSDTRSLDHNPRTLIISFAVVLDGLSLLEIKKGKNSLPRKLSPPQKLPRVTTI